VKDGCHIASMGGTWMVFAYGFGGLRDYEGILAFCPRRSPEMTALLRFPLTYRGQVLEVEIGNETVEYTLREGENLIIRHEAEEVRLTRDQPTATRQVGRW
jgi:alpha,alpha-trehalose phosphorylase